MRSNKLNEKQVSNFTKLPSITGEVLRLYYEEQLSLREICTSLNKSMCVIRNHYHRGIFLLKNINEIEVKQKKN